jgi:hypothetical protein
LPPLAKNFSTENFIAMVFDQPKVKEMLKDVSN